MLALAASGSAEGLWLRAEAQSAGRGRQGRAWVSATGNLYISTLVRLRASDPQAATLALVAAVALEEAVSAFPYSREGGSPGVRATPPAAVGSRLRGSTGFSIKWPNDLMLDGAKLAGILLERSGDAVVIGFGVNCTHAPDLPDRATAHLNGTIDPAILAETLAESFTRWLSRWRGEGLAPVRQRWQERAHPPGTALTARLPDGSAIDGLFSALDSEGALILRLADGTSRVIHAADIFLL